MQPHVLKLTVATALALISAATAFAQPMQFSEVSLLVRARENEASIKSEVAQRKLAQPLTPDQEATLKKQGASDSLVQTLRSSPISANEANTVTPRRTGSASRVSTGTVDGGTDGAALHFRATGLSTDNVQIIDLGIGEPVNLSTWGGADREFVFSRRSITDLRRTYSFFESENFPSYRDPYADLTIDELTMVEPVGSFDHTSNYQNLERGRSYLSEYASKTEHRFTRPMTIQRHNPIHIDGVPYNLYPIYSAGGASLYYIGRISEDVVRVAVISRWR